MTNCQCGQPLWAPISKRSGVCEYCRRYGPAEAGSRGFPYTFAVGYTPPDKRKDDDEPNLYAPPPPDPHRVARIAQEVAKELKRKVAKAPRCSVCKKPLMMGQLDAHLGCRR